MRAALLALIALALPVGASAQGGASTDEPVQPALANPASRIIHGPRTGSGREPHLEAARGLSASAERLWTLWYRLLDAELGASGNAVRTASPRARALEARARRTTEEAIARLDRIDAAAPQQARVEALALRAFLLDSLGRGPEALATAQSLVALCPSCPQVAEGHLRIADAAFESGDLAGALEAYGRVIAMDEAAPRLRAHAHYKTGWARLNLSDFEGAWAALDAARREATAAEIGSLAREAARDQVEVLVHLAVGPAAALERIRAIADGAVDAQRLQGRYAERLRDVGRTREADAFERAAAD